jgi:uncharacterized membrane protein YfcA
VDIAVGLVAGLVAGVISGMLGVGGGTISIPAMVLLLDVGQHTAQGVALAAMMFTAMVAAFVHYRQGNVKLSAVLLIAPSAVGFSYLGAWAAGQVTAVWLTRIFAVFLLLVGFRMLLFKRGGPSVATD